MHEKTSGAIPPFVFGLCSYRTNTKFELDRLSDTGFQASGGFGQFLSPSGDLEMDLSGDIPSIQWHLGLSVPNVFKPFNTDLTSQVEPGIAKYSLEQPSTAW